MLRLSITALRILQWQLPSAEHAYYYLAPDAGTYSGTAITPPEHLQMGMVGQIYVRPRQNRVPAIITLYAALQAQQLDPRTACNPSADILHELFLQ
jgi:hypothetical protein